MNGVYAKLNLCSFVRCNYIDMEIIYIFIAVAMLVQGGIFLMNRARKRSERNDLLSKYNIKNRGDLFKMINSQRIPEDDRLLLEKLYQKNF